MPRSRPRGHMNPTDPLHAAITITHPRPLDNVPLIARKVRAFAAISIADSLDCTADSTSNTN